MSNIIFVSLIISIFHHSLFFFIPDVLRNSNRIFVRAKLFLIIVNTPLVTLKWIQPSPAAKPVTERITLPYRALRTTRIICMNPAVGSSRFILPFQSIRRTDCWYPRKTWYVAFPHFLYFNTVNQTINWRFIEGIVFCFFPAGYMSLCVRLWKIKSDWRGNIWSGLSSARYQNR